MIVEPHRGMRVRHRAIGVEGAPLLVVDQAVADPERLIRKAARMDFEPVGSYFPGVRARAPLSYQYFLEALLRPLLLEIFQLQPGPITFPMCHYSLASTAPEKLRFLQRIPHIDSTTGHGLATVHYLFRGDWGGTSFYRHRATGFEYVDCARKEDYYNVLSKQSERAESASNGYIAGDTALFERIDSVEGVFNRLLVYRRNSLHSGDIDNQAIPPPDPVAGRLSINTFLDVQP